MSPKPSLPRGHPVKICSPVRGFFTPVVHLPHRVDLRRVRHVASSARVLQSELHRIEMASARIVDDAVLQAVEASHASTAAFVIIGSLAGGMIGCPSVA